MYRNVTVNDLYRISRLLNLSPSFGNKTRRCICKISGFYNLEGVIFEQSFAPLSQTLMMVTWSAVNDNYLRLKSPLLAFDMRH